MEWQMTDINETVREQFGSTAQAYRTSAVHAAGVDLAKLAELASQGHPARVLDLGCGAGHASIAVAPHAGEVVAYDLTQPMLEQVALLAQERGVGNVRTRQGDVTQLPFQAGEFDWIITRYSAHHWRDPQAAVNECRRVLKAGGTLLVSDTAAPEEPLFDTVLQTIEILRDRSHVRNYRISEWRQMLQRAGFTAELLLTWDIRLEFDSWVTRMRTPRHRIDAIKAVFDEAPEEARAFLKVEADYTFTNPGALIRGVCASA
jgi:ubiquinone/menaquinone biosynthesis C-methylase UbiE